MIFAWLFISLKLLLHSFATHQDIISFVYPCLQYCTSPHFLKIHTSAKHILCVWPGMRNAMA